MNKTAHDNLLWKYVGKVKNENCLNIDHGFQNKNEIKVNWLKLN